MFYKRIGCGTIKLINFRKTLFIREFQHKFIRKKQLNNNLR